MNGQGGRLSRRTRSRHRDTRKPMSRSSDREEKEKCRLLKRRTARVAVNKIKLLEASLSDEDCEEDEPRRRLRSSRRTAVIQSSSESEGASAQGRQS